MAGKVDEGASGDIALAILRRNGSIGVPVYLWTLGGWVDFLTLTGPQFSAWVDVRCAGVGNSSFADAAAGSLLKVPNFTISRTNDW